MLVLLLTWLNITLVSLGFGMMLQSRLFPGAKSLSDCLIQGFILSISLAQWISLIFPVNALLNLIFSLISLVWLGINRRQIPLPGLLKPQWLLVPGMLLLILHSLLMSNAFPVLPDTWFYHSQSVKWTETFRAVPGLGNFFSNLAYNSSVFVGNALFSPRWMLDYPAFPLNSFLWMLALLLMIKRSLQPAMVSSRAMLLLDWAMLLLLYRYFHPVLSTSSQDPAAAIWLFLAWLSLNKATADQNRTSSGLSLLMIAAFLLSVKLSHALLVLPALYWSLKQPSLRLKGSSLLLVAVIILPWMLRNLVLSGYLFYPVAWPDLLQADWKIPAEDLHFEQKLIRSWASDPGLPLDGNQDFYRFAWVSGWMARSGWFNLLLLGSWILSLTMLLIPSYRSYLKKSGLGIWLLCLVAAGVLWFLSAPSIRFVLGILLFSLMIPARWLLLRNANDLSGKSMWLLFYGLLLFSLSAARSTTGEALERQGSILAPLPPPEARVREIRLNDVDFYYIDPRDLKAYDHALPAGPQYREGLRMRSPLLKDGFRIDRQLRRGGPEGIRHYYESQNFTRDTLH